MDIIKKISTTIMLNIYCKKTWYKPCGICGRPVAINHSTEEKRYFYINSFSGKQEVPLCAIHRPETVDALVFQIYKRIKSLEREFVVVINCDDEKFFVNGKFINTEVGDKLMNKFNRWSKSHKHDTRIRKVGEMYIGYWKGELRDVNGRQV